MYTITPKQAYQEIVECASVGLVPLITSSPGMGKSSIVNQVAKDYRLKLIDIRLGQAMPEDLNGFPMRNGNKASFVPFDIFPLEGDELPDGCEGWLLFLDEFTSATKPVQAAAYKLVLDRMVGTNKLHPQVIIVAAGNKVTDKAVVNQMSTAMQSRLVHYEMEVSGPEWLEHAVTKGLDHRITGFISYMPSKLMDFRPDHQDKTFPCPRTWEFLSKLVKGKPVGPEIGARIAGTIGQGAAVEFITFAQEFDRLPKFADIINDPVNTPVPEEASTKYATLSMLIDRFDEKSLDQVIDYVERFPTEIQIIFCRGAVAKKSDIHDRNQKFSGYLRRMVRYLQ